MGLLNFPNAPTNPGSLMGATRSHRAVLENLQADAFRSGAQSQNTGQAARAFSGANVDNAQTQLATLSQTATAANTKTVTIGAVASTISTTGFNNNHFQRYIAGADAADLLARGAANLAQDQGVDQSAFASHVDFSGTKSDADNSLTQGAKATQLFDVDLSATVNVTTKADDAGSAFQQSRFRSVEALMKDQAAQAVFTSGQRQGSSDAPGNQIAVSDGGDQTTNTLTQAAEIVQTSNDVRLTGTFQLSTDEGATGILAPRATDLLASMMSNTAVNSSAASQEQVHMQSAAGGVDEDGNVTENGGNSMNTGSQSETNTEDTDVTNSVSIII